MGIESKKLGFDKDGSKIFNMTVKYQVADIFATFHSLMFVIIPQKLVHMMCVIVDDA